MLTELTGPWSSIMASPAEGKDEPANLNRDGVMQIDAIDYDTGVITGHYYDIDTHYTLPLNGSIRFSGSTYAWAVRHSIPNLTGRIRIYEGQFISEAHGISLVGGRWTQIYTDSSDAKEIGKAVEVESDAQVEGVWVATKP